MTFTDDDLRRLKEDLEKHIVIDLVQEQGLALLARLEAAERYAGYAEWFEPVDAEDEKKYNECKEAWREARK